ncbi:ferredoxin reductase-like protein [Lindgomyces ingoldianus]|uniref:Ferredoxin reductase-like protein n=1 Tax=Lindgomyces ingoldianus TaxID=673940 RepID=A0ACB6QV38_9PLEO|nr:ferredoxin reductase-like protein [Lindgomyces ingoldianus]KAF2470874.1 ferredoxin reductase-like protein [Lindgomyces ingoldianus]
MFARQVFRPANTVRQHVRRYASDPPKSGGNNSILYTGIALAALSGGYFYMRRGTPTTALPKAEAKKVSGSVAAPVKAAFTGGEQGFLSLVLEKADIINHNTKKFTFKLPEEDMESGLPIASAVITKYKGPNMEKPVIRPYTPTSDTDQKGYVEFIVKKYPNGPMSEHMHNMEPGQRLDIKGPIPKYPWSPNKHEHVAMIAGGTGITPMWQVANAIFKNPEDKTKVTLVFGNISEEDILLKKELERLENTYPQRFRAFYVLDNPPEQWQGGKGFVTKELLKTVLPEPKEGEKIKIFVCGPPGMYKAISGGKKSPTDQGELDGILKDLGYSKDQVYKF